MLMLVVASGICGLLLGWYFKIYVTLPMVLVLLGPAYFLVLLSQSVAAFIDRNHIFEKTHFSARGG